MSAASVECRKHKAKCKQTKGPEGCDLCTLDRRICPSSSQAGHQRWADVSFSVIDVEDEDMRAPTHDHSVDEVAATTERRIPRRHASACDRCRTRKVGDSPCHMCCH
ncbi:hypothetical protein PIIN_11188 [Serendipita indica DSM 11827]|uniref:Uncharacterized protein n=1 Tax=Serendipita indica (strain DSM 11827) TaxID=1109443 RepID=G4U0W3_SERID|nr:hypothetical protein PIIN_11188 [Serendipita indica DSM 11827]